MALEQDYPDRRFIIFNVSELNKIDFDQVYETDEDTVRVSVDGTKTFVKYDLPMPSSVSSLETKSQEYTFEEMLSILSTSEWIDPNPLP